MKSIKTINHLVLAALLAVLCTAGMAAAESTQTFYDADMPFVGFEMNANPFNRLDELKTLFMKDYDGDGTFEADELNKNVICTLSAGSGVTITEKQLNFVNAVYPLTEVEDIEGPCFTYMVTGKEADGQTITMSISNSEGDSASYELTLDVADMVFKEPTIEGNYTKLVKDGATAYSMLIEEGASVTVALDYETLDGQKADVTISWDLYDYDLGAYTTSGVVASDESCTFTDLKGNCEIEWTAELTNATGVRQNGWIYVVSAESGPTYKWRGLNASTDGKCVLDTTGDVPQLYLQKGATVTVTPSYTYQGVGTHNYSWNFYDWDTMKDMGQVAATETYTFTFEHSGNLNFVDNISDGTRLSGQLYLNLLEEEEEPAPEPIKVSIVQDFTGFIYADGTVELNVNLMNAIFENSTLMSHLFPNGVTDTANARANYEYTWSMFPIAANGTHKLEPSYEFSKDSGWNGVTCGISRVTETTARSFVGKELMTGYIDSADGYLRANINFRLKELVYAPSFDYTGEDTVYIEYMPGDTVTIETPAAVFGGEQTAYYHLLREEMHDDGAWVYGFMTNQKNNAFTFKATAEMDGYRLVPDLSLEAWEEARHSWGAGVTYILKSKKVEVKVEEVKESAPLPEKISDALDNLGIETYGELFTHMDTVLLEEQVLPQTVTVTELTKHPMELTLVDEQGVEITEEYFEKNDSLTVYMDAPAGTNVQGYTFYGVHTHQMDDLRGNRFKAGDTEVLDIRIVGGQLCFDMTSMSPIQIYSIKNPEVDIPKTGDSSNPLLWACCLLMGLGGCAFILRKSRRSHN